MSTYVIGDVQGCWRSLQALMQNIAFQPGQDTVAFVGDLINRGTHSLDVLRFVMDLDNPVMVLGNHEIYCLITAQGHLPREQYKHTLHDIFDAPDCDDMCRFLSAQPLIKHLPQYNAVLVHAGIPPNWSLAEAKQQADRVHDCLQSKKADDFLPICFGNQPTHPKDAHNTHDSMRYTINALTRMRFCTQAGELDLENKGTKHDNPNFKPWFEWERQDNMPDILFGHWARQRGVFNHHNAIGLDTGCVYGDCLTALRLEDKQYFKVASVG